jgi:hypothetical protein
VFGHLPGAGPLAAFEWSGMCYRARAKAKGVRFGRPPILSPHQRREAMQREGIVQNLYYRWSKDFLEAGKCDGCWERGRPAPR